MMNILHNKSFDKQIALYILIVLVITFTLISITLVNSLKQFINNNAYNQSRIVASNILFTFEHQLIKTELVPQSVFEFFKHIDPINTAALPINVLKSYPMFVGCSVHYDTTHPGVCKIPDISAYRNENDSIIYITSPKNLCYTPNFTASIRKTSKGFWIHSKVNGENTRAYCEPILDENNIPYGILKIDLTTRTLTNIICNYKLYNSGYLFIIDDQGDFIAHPDLEISKHKNIYNPKLKLIKDSSTIQKFIKGEFGYTTVMKNKTKHCLYFSPISQMNWRLGIMCPYDEILVSSNKLYFLLFACLSIGLLFTFGCIILIVRNLSTPLKQFTTSVRTIAEGQFDTVLIVPNSNPEIQDLYAAFSYMQKNLISYIERIKTNMNEKERIDTEMKLAQKIQQRFLPHLEKLPSNIELFGELKQCREVGGDLYEYFIVNNKLYFAIGDVSGKGTPAALYMASTIKLFRYIASGKNSTAEICNIINVHMCDRADDDMYITMFVGIMDLSDGSFIFTNAGHPYPIILHNTGEINLLDKYPDVPIGILDDHIYSEHTYTLAPCTQIILYTDGVTDAENIDSQFYGKEKMYACIKQTHIFTPKKIVNAILDDINCHIYGNTQSDDLTLLSILYKGNEECNSQH